MLHAFVQTGSQSQCTAARPRGLSFHEPEGRARQSPARRLCIAKLRRARSDAPYRFMVPMHAPMRKGASMNRPSTESQQAFESGAEDARTPNAVARSADSASAKRLECVRFIGAFGPALRLRGSWSLCRAVGPRGLSMNRRVLPASCRRSWDAPPRSPSQPKAR